MSATEIILLLIGIAAFIASFVIPEQKSKATETDRRLSEELVKETIEQEVSSAKVKIQDLVEETVSYSTEKTERILERLTNEKMQAVNDYSDTVLTEINKNHKEVLFLYDMLNDKQQNIQETVKDVNKTAKTVQDTVEKAEKTAINAVHTTTEQVSEESLKEKEVPKKKTAVKKENSKANAKTIIKTKNEENVNDDFKRLTGDKIVIDRAIPDIDFMVGGENSKNNNGKILELHKSGKSNMAIAKELGLGIGEVKLVIDLFEGM